MAKVKSCGIPLSRSRAFLRLNILLHCSRLTLRLRPRFNFCANVELGRRENRTILQPALGRFAVFAYSLLSLSLSLARLIVFPSRNQRLVPLALNRPIDMSGPDQQTPTAATASTAAESTRQQNAADDNLPCQWDNCNERCDSPEALYVSLCPAVSIAPQC